MPTVKCAQCGADCFISPSRFDEGGEAYCSEKCSQIVGKPQPDLDDTFTLRDRFAAAALTGLLADHNLTGKPFVFAQWAYEHADAMLEARES